LDCLNGDIVINKLNKTIMKKILLIALILIGIQSFGQEVNLPQTSDKWVTQPMFNPPNPHQLRQMDIQRNQNIIILMVNENQIRNFNQWRLWRRLKENKRERIVRRWQKRHGRNNIQPESLRRRHR
jgi:hypothetical protein